MKRRQFLQSLLSLYGISLLPRVSSAAWGAASQPHFLLHLEALGGMDNSFFFDARDLAMTHAGKIHTYPGTERIQILGKNGVSALATDISKPLLPYRDYFSIINGVHMNISFEGHEENLRYFVTGNPFGAENYLPHLNGITEKYPIDGISASPNFFAEGIPGTNTGNIIPLAKEPGLALAECLKAYGIPDTDSPANSYLMDVFARTSKGQGRFPAGVTVMKQNFADSPYLGNKLKNINLSDTSSNRFQAGLNLLLSCFKEKITNTGVMQLTDDPAALDNHDFGSAKNFALVASGIVNNLIFLIETLRHTPFDDQRSFFDVTTFIMGSEFSRTMRQEGFTVDQTGTDHNTLNNTIILGGAGINGGHVIGASDFQTPDEKLSGAHLSLDQKALKIMGRPFDFVTGLPANKLPENYQAEDYLGVNSVINTIYSAFNAPKEVFRTIRNGNPALAPVLKDLLKSFI